MSRITKITPDEEAERIREYQERAASLSQEDATDHQPATFAEECKRCRRHVGLQAKTRVGEWCGYEPLIERLRDSWRKQFPDVAPPVVPEASTKEQAYLAIDCFLRTLGALKETEEWVSASTAVERFNSKGIRIDLPWISKRKQKLRTRPRELPGNHKLEVEWNSLIKLFFEEFEQHTEQEPDEEQKRAIEARKQAECKRKTKSPIPK